MRIIELYVENFGKLSQYRKTFSPTLNTFCLDNGAGKTTLTVFIKAMLYGLDTTHKQSLSENERKKYTPWQSGAFGGWLSFESDGKRYKIERSFSQKASDDKFTLYNLDTGAVSDDFSANLGEELFGIDADGFERTVFHSEKTLSEKNENRSIAAKLSDLVGVEGDIGDFDEAIALLEKRRMFYHKRGGAGEIQSTSNAIAEIEERIAEIDRKEALLAEYEGNYSSLTEESRALREEKNALLRQRRESEDRKHRLTLTSQYKNMLASLKADEVREGELLEFFKNKIPTLSEIRQASAQLEEAKRLTRSSADSGENAEYLSLTAFFKTPTTYEECDKMIRLAQRVEAADNTVPESVKNPPVSPFAKTPTESEIAEYSELSASKNNKKNKHGAALPMIIIGFLLAGVTGALGILVSALLFAPAAFGVLIAVLGIVMLAAPKKEDSTVRDFIRSVFGDGKESISELSALIEMRAALERYRSEQADYERRKESYEAEAQKIALERNVLEEFLAKFDTPPYSLTEKVRYVSEKYQKFTLLSEQADKSLSESRETLKRAAALQSEAEEFIKCFATVSASPLDEIRNNLAEYEVLHASLTRRRSDAERFALMNGITAESLAEAESTDVSVAGTVTDGSIATLDSRLLALEGDISSKKSAIATLCRDIETRPVLEEKLLELTEKRERYEENLSVIKKAKELLGKAKTNLTARYLDSTCRGFGKYVTYIDGDSSEFSMDTSFTVKRDDMGAARETAFYSRGTKELYSLAVRLALSDALYEGELPPIILDDPFTSFDDSHTEKALSLVKKLSEDRQILYFTCSKSRKIK